LKVLFVASEAVPLVKTGGLADVIGSLPEAIARCGVDARVMLPRYATLEATHLAIESIGTLSADLLPGITLDAPATLQRAYVHNGDTSTVFYLIDAPQFFNRPELYGYDDDILRFGYFNRACLAALPLIEASDGWRPDIIHGHDWHTGLLPAFLRTVPELAETARTTKTIFTIHNLAYQGLADKQWVQRLGLDWSLFNYHQLEYYDRLNPLKSGLVFSDAITTVSEGYAEEIQTPEYGAGLEGVLQEHAHVLYGIVNGIDYTQWTPRHDPALAANYEAGNPNGKADCKHDLLKAVELTTNSDDDQPVIGIVSRLSSQKGFDLVAAAMEPLLDLGCKLVVLGAGDDYYMRLFEELGRKFPQRTAFVLGQRNEVLAHKIYAGSDLFLMPSHYEPCGLSQMISLAYGTIPIVRETGGLADTVHEFDASSGLGNGFVFKKYNTVALIDAVRRAVSCYHSPAWPQLMSNAFACDFSWDVSALRYAELYRSVTEKHNSA